MSGFSAAALAFGLAASAVASPPGPDVSYTLPRQGSGVLIRLENGQEVRGVFLRREDGAAWIGVDQGEIGLDENEITAALPGATGETEYRARERALKPGDASGFWELSQWARERGLDASARAAARRAIDAAPDHAAAHAFLGEEKVGGYWLGRDAAMLARGYVEDEGLWITRKEKAALADSRRLAAQAEEKRRSEAALRDSIAYLTRLEAQRQARAPEPTTYVLAGYVTRRGPRGILRLPDGSGPSTARNEHYFAPLFGPNYFEQRRPLDP